MARSRSGTRGRRGPRKPPRRDGGFQTQVQTIDPRERGPIELPGTITVQELAELLGVNVADIIREDRELLTQGLSELPNPLRGDVVFENVSFSYGDDAEVLRNISFRVKAGQSVAVREPAAK